MTSLEKVVAAVYGTDTSEEISCTDRFLGDDAIDMLCDKLLHTFADNKKKLILRGNCISSKGAAALSNLLRQKHTLQFVSLEWNQIGQPGAKAFANALMDNKSLLHLDLRNNGLNNEGAIALANALSTNTSLKVLDLRWNQIEDNGALAFKEALIGRNPALSLLISGNSLTESTTKIIDDWTKLGKLTIHEPLPPVIPESNNQSHLFQNELLQKEIASLRQQCMSLQSVFADVQRQLDGSALRVTDLEQQLSREQYRFNHANEALNQANARISAQGEEQKALCATWERERGEIKEELHRVVKVKNEEVRLLTGERDGAREKLQACEDDNVRLRAQAEALQAQYNADQLKLENEVRQQLNRISDLSLQETKIKTENTSLKAANKRLTEKVAALTEELETAGSEHDKILAREAERHHTEMEKWKADNRQAMDRLVERNTALTKEVASLQSLLSQLKSGQANELLELEQRHNEALKTMRAEEKKRCEQSLSDLKQRLDLMTLARSELDSRWSALNTEMKGMREEHRVHLEQLQSQLADISSELQRQININANLKVALSSAETSNKNNSFELDDLRKRYQAAHAQSESWSKDVQHLTHDKQLLQSKHDKLEQLHSNHMAARAHDFDVISKHVVRCVEKELETLRVDLKITSGTKHH